MLVYIVDYLVKDESQPHYDSSHSSGIVETSLPANLPEEVASAPQTRSTSSVFNNVFNFSPGFQWSRGNSANQGSRGYQNSINYAASSRPPTGLGNSWYSFRGLRRGEDACLYQRKSSARLLPQILLLIPSKTTDSCGICAFVGFVHSLYIRKVYQPVTYEGIFCHN